MAQLPLALAGAALLLGAATLPAQNRRAVPLPDTLGANFSIADSATAAGTAADYDFLEGSWHFTYQTRRPDGSFNPPTTGHWTATKKFFERYNDGGREVIAVLVEDHWRPDDSTASAANGVYTWRSFISTQPRWVMQGINSWEVDWQPGQTWSDGSNRYAIQHRVWGIARIRYLAIGANSSLWRSDRSTDGGRTWLLDAATMLVQRVGQ